MGSGERTLFRKAYGQVTHDKESPNLKESSVFDVGELTAVMVTVPTLLKLSDEGRLSFSDRVSRYMQGFGVHGKSAVTVEQLLRHSSVLPAYIPFFEQLSRDNRGKRVGILTSRGAHDFVLREITRFKVRGLTSRRQQYSQVGYILLGFLIEALTGLSLSTVAERVLFRPLRLRSTSYIDLSMLQRGAICPDPDVVVPTDGCSWRKRRLCGEVFEENAWAMGGVAGHSGLFSSASDLDLFLREVLRAQKGISRFLTRENIANMWEIPEENMRDGACSLWFWLGGALCRKPSFKYSAFSRFSRDYRELWLCALA